MSSRCVLPCLAVSFIVSATLAQAPLRDLPVVQTLQGHTELVYSVCFTPDGKQLVSGAFDKAVNLWDVASGKELKSFAGAAGHQDIILCTTINSAGTLIASSGKDNSIKLWEIPGKALMREFAGSAAPLGPMNVSPDGAKLASLSVDGSIRLWESKDGKALPVIAGLGKPLQSLAMSANNQMLAAGAADGTIGLWNLSDGKLQGTVAAHVGAITAVAFHPNNQLLYTASADGTCKSWQLPLGGKKSVELAGKTSVVAMAQSLDGSRFILGCSDKSVRVMKADTGAQEKLLPPAPAEIAAVAWGGNVIIAGLVDGRVAIWDANSGELLNVYEFNRGRRVNSLSLRSDGNELVGTFEDGVVRFTEISKDKNKPLDELYGKRLPLQPVGTTVVSYYPADANQCITAGPENVLRWWRIREGKNDRNLPLEGTCRQIAWSKDGARLAALVGNAVQIFQFADGKSLGKFPHPAAITFAQLTPDGQRLTTTCDDGKVRLWDVGTAKELGQLSADKPRAASFSADGKQGIVVVAQAVEVHAASPGKTIAKFAPLRTLTLLENGAKAVVAGDDGIARLVNLASGAVEKEFKGHQGPVLAVAATPIQQLLITAGMDKSVRIFSIADGKELKSLPQPAPVTSLTVPGTGTLAILVSDKAARVIKLPFTAGQPLSPEFGKEVQQFDQPGAITGLAVHGDTIFTAGADKLARAWKLAGDGPSKNLTGHTALVDAVAFSPDGQTLASCSHDGTLRLWNPNDGKQSLEVKLTPQPQPFYCLAWRPDGKQIAVGGFDQGIRLIDLTAKKVEREIKGYDEKSSPQGHRDAVYSVAYSPNGQTIYSAGADGQIKLWKTADGSFLKALVDPALKEKAQRDWINQIKLSVDGKRLVAVGNGGWMTFWNVEDGKLLHEQKLPTGLYGTALTQDGRLVATGNQNGTIYLLKIP
jgi:WD40 repeat protein